MREKDLRAKAELCHGPSGRQLIVTEGNQIGFSSFVRINQVTYLDHNPVEVAAIISVNASEGIYNIGSSTVKISGMVFIFQGLVNSKPSYADIDLTLSSKDADIASVLSLLPTSLTRGLSKFNCTGDIDSPSSFAARSAK